MVIEPLVQNVRELVPMVINNVRDLTHDIRRRVREGRSIRFLVPDAVRCYIDEHELYRTMA